MEQQLVKTDTVTTVEWDRNSIKLTGVQSQCLSQRNKVSCDGECWLNDNVSKNDCNYNVS